MQEVKRQMNVLMWELAYESEDMIFNHYPPNGNAEIGPAINSGHFEKNRDLVIQAIKVKDRYKGKEMPMETG